MQMNLGQASAADHGIAQGAFDLEEAIQGGRWYFPSARSKVLSHQGTQPVGRPKRYHTN
jgi:hypothetical protein